MKSKLKEYYVYYHQRGRRKNAFNQMRKRLKATNTSDAYKKAKKELGKLWVIESVRKVR